MAFLCSKKVDAFNKAGENIGVKVCGKAGKFIVEGSTRCLPCVQLKHGLLPHGTAPPVSVTLAARVMNILTLGLRAKV